MEEAVEKLIEYLSFFGRASYLRPNFANERELDFAGVELVTTSKIEEGLLEEINSHLDEKAGIPASLRSVAWAELKGGMFRYVIEIIPYSFVPIREYPEATAEVLRALPKIIKTYRMKNGKR